MTCFSSWLLQIKLQETLLEMQLTPFSILLRALLDQLQAKDQAKIFTQPVDVNEVIYSKHMNACSCLPIATINNNCNFLFFFFQENCAHNDTY